jgi:hypothetical protein
VDAAARESPGAPLADAHGIIDRPADGGDGWLLDVMDEDA